MENHYEIEIIQNNNKYVLSLDIVNNTLVINCCDMNSLNKKGFYVEYTHEQLKQFSQAFFLTKTLYDDFNLFKSAIQSKNIKIYPQNNDLYITFGFNGEENFPNNMNFNANLHLEPNPQNFNSISNIEYSPVRYLPTIHVRMPTINERRPTIYINDDGNNFSNNQIKTNILNPNLYNIPKKNETNINHYKTYTQQNQNQNNIKVIYPSTPKKDNYKNISNDYYNSPLGSPRREQIQINNYGSPSKNEYFYSSYKNQQSNTNNIPNNINNRINIRRVDSDLSTSANESEEKINKLQNEFQKLQIEFQKQKLKENELIKKINELKEENEKLKLDNQMLLEKENVTNSIINENNSVKSQLINIQNKYNEFEKYKIEKDQETKIYKEKIEELAKEKDNLEKELNEYKEENLNFMTQLKLSKNQKLRIVRGEIIQSNEELEFLTQKICKDHKKITLNLLYKATVDSDRANIFHKRCDKAKSSLVLIQSDNDKRFGGFTTCDWEGDGLEKVDKNAFVFSLDKMKTYDVIPEEKAIGCYQGFGPIFLGCQIRIYDKAFENGGSTYHRGANYNTEENFELTGGEQEYKVKEIEVYEVILE